MRTIFALALVAWALGIPGVARAADLTFAIDGAAEYDSNVFRSSGNEEDDYLFRITPSARLHEDRGQDLSYSLRYALPVEFSVQNSDLNDVDQDASASASYHVNDRTELFASNNFRYVRSELLTNLEGTEGRPDALLVNQQRDRITLNDASVGSNYQFTPRLAGIASLEHNYYDPSRDDRATTNDLTGTSRLVYALTPKHKVGGGFQGGWQKFTETDDIVASTAQSYSLFGSWEWAIDEKTGISVAAGPAVILDQQDDPERVEFKRLVPGKNVGSFRVQKNGFFDETGAPIVPGTPAAQFPDGALVVGNNATCNVANIAGMPTTVMNSGKSCSLNVVLDKAPGGDTTLINNINAANATKVQVVNQNPSGDDTTDLNVFAVVTLRRDWTPTLHTALNYRREQGTASGLGGSVVSDNLSLSGTYDLTEKWQLSGRGDFTLRTSVSQATRVLSTSYAIDGSLGGGAGVISAFAPTVGGTGASNSQRTDETNIDTMRWGLAGRVTRFLTRNTSGYLQLTYNKQTSKSDSLGDPSDFDDYLVTVGIQHVFEPIKLW